MDGWMDAGFPVRTCPVCFDSCVRKSAVLAHRGIPVE